MEISHIILRTINPSDASDPFIAYLDRPVWFKERFQAAFDAHRLEILTPNNAKNMRSVKISVTKL